MKVLHVINSLTAGGAEILLANSLSEGGLQAYTENIVVYFQGTSAVENRIDSNVQVICLGYKGLSNLPSTLLKLRRIIKKHKIDIVHSHLNPAGVYTSLICPVPQVHTIHTAYSMDKETLPSKLFIERKLYLERKNCNLIFLTDFTEKDLLQTINFKGHSYVLNNFIPDIYFKPASKKYKTAGKSLKLVSVARLTAGKNLEFLLQVFAHLKHLNVQLDIYGDGDIASYNKIITEKSLNVRMMGHCNDTSQILTNYDAFILPTKFEGFGLAIFEAMAAGLPALVSDIEPLKNILKDNVLYFGLNDSAKVATLIASIYNGKTDLDEITLKGFEYAGKTVRRQQYISKLLGIYNEILKK